MGVFIKILKVDTRVGLEKKYAVILSSTMEIFYNFVFYDVLVPIQCISVLWTPACHQLFLHRYAVCGCKIFTW